MAGNWNPSYPSLLGLEWPGHYQIFDDYIGTGSPLRGEVLRSTGSETVTGLRFGIQQAPFSALPLLTRCDVYPLTELPEDPADLLIQQIKPDAHGASGTGTWANQAGSGVNIWQSIDDTVQWPLTPAQQADYIFNAFPSSTAYFHFDTGAFALNRRITRLRILAVAGPKTGTRSMAFQLRHSVGPTDFVMPTSQVSTTGYTTLVQVDMGEINPVTLLPWTPADVRSFEAAASPNFQLSVRATGTPTNRAQVYSMALEVSSVPMNLAAVGMWQRPPNSNPGRTITTDALVSPDTTNGDWDTNWAKPSSGDFVYILRKANDPAVSGAGPFATDIRWEHIGGADRHGTVSPPVPGMKSMDVGYGNPHGLVWSTPANTATYKERPEQARLDLIASGPATSNDSQPYSIDVNVPSYTAYNGGQLVQRFEPTSGTPAYVGVRGVISPPLVATGPTTYRLPNLGERTARVTVNRESDSVQFGGELILDARELLDQAAITGMPDYRWMEGFLAPGTGALATGTGYELRLQPLSGPTGGAGTLGWTVAVLTALDNGVPNAKTATFQGDADGWAKHRTPPPVTTTSDTRTDIGWMLVEQPASVIHQAAVTGTQPLNLGQSTFCRVPGIDYIGITWDNGAVYTHFDHWEIERNRQSNPGVWLPAASGDNLSRRSWQDYEVKRGEPTRYRIRVVYDNGAVSDWALTDFAVANHYGAEVAFVSNVRPELNVAYEHEPGANFDFLDHDGDQLMKVQGAPFRAMFMDPADRGVGIGYELVVNFADVPQLADGTPIGAERVFDPLRDISRSRNGSVIPYVCSLDHKGNRRFAYLRISDGVEQQPQERYAVQADVIPIAAESISTAIVASHLMLDGTAPTEARRISTAGVSLAGDQTLMVEIDTNGWSINTIQTLYAKWVGSGNQRSIMLQLVEDGRWRVIHSPDGTSGAQQIKTSSVPFSSYPNGRVAIAVALDVNVGGATNEARFYDAPSIYGPWTERGAADSDAGTTSVFLSSSPLEVGGHDNGTLELFTGRVVAARLVNGLIASTDVRTHVNFADQIPGTNPVQEEPQGAETYLLDGTAVVMADDV